MDALLLWILHNWFYCIGVLLAFVAAFGFLIFLRGFLLGLNQVYFIDSNAEYLDLARIRVSWGLLLMIQAFVAWVFVAGVASLFGYGQVHTQATEWILGIYLLIVVAHYFNKNVLKKK